VDSRRDRIAAWVLLVIATFAFGASFVQGQNDQAFIELNEKGMREQRAHLRMLMKSPVPSDILLTNAVDSD
jgi:hypothetical protein